MGNVTKVMKFTLRHSFFWGGAVSDFIELDLKKNDIFQ